MTDFTRASGISCVWCLSSAAMRFLAAAVVVLLLGPAAAQASDRTLLKTWKHHRNAPAKFNGDLKKSEDVKRSKRELRGVIADLADTRKDLAADSGSTPDGDAARKAGLAAVKASTLLLHRFLPLVAPLAEAIEDTKVGETDGIGKLFKKLDVVLKSAKRVARLEQRANKLFKRLR